MTESAFKPGDAVAKNGGDYTFNGYVVAVFRKRSGVVRVVVENPAGILHIFSEANLSLVDPPVALGPDAVCGKE